MLKIYQVVTKTRTYHLWLVLMIGMMSSATALASADIMAGKDYRQLSNSIPLSDNGTITVEQWVWPGCAACNMITGLQQSVAADGDVDWLILPAVMRNDWFWHAKLMLAIQDLQRLALMPLLMLQVSREPNSLTSLQAAQQWLIDQGITQDVAEREITSPVLNQQLKVLQQRQQQLGLRGVPAVVVDGRYVVDAGMANTAERFREIVAFLINKVQQEQSERK